MILLIALYTACAAFLGAYALVQLHMVYLWRRAARRTATPIPLTGPLPAVTVQLPIFNEAAVVEELIDAACALEWGGDLQIQILDDSTDRTTALAQGRAAHHRARGVDVEVVRRPSRQGFKAGALAHGLTSARGDVIAIFDADFRPNPDFLTQAAPWLTEGVGFVQARWGWLNPRENLFTRVLSFHMDAHFTVEQAARASALWMGFNGTAGLWRRACIEDAGGWSADTLTEDLDLALRAQLKGWRGIYVDSLEVPSEVPAEVSAIRTQQHRWMKGGGQVAAKLLGPIWRSGAPLTVRLHATVQLLGNLLFAVVLALTLMTPFLVALGASGAPEARWLLPAALLTQLSLVALCVTYLGASLHRYGPRGLWRFVVGLPSLLSLSSGLAVHNALAAVEGIRGRPSPFLRTPKKGRGAASELSPPPPWVWVEALMALWCGLSLAVSIHLRVWPVTAFATLQFLGFTIVVAASLAPVIAPRAQGSLKLEPPEAGGP